MPNEQLDSYYACYGHNVILYRYQPAFTEFIYRCYQQSEFMQKYRLHQKRGSGQSLSEELRKTQSLPPGTLKSIEWVICKRGSNEPIGLAALANYQVQHKTAELLIGLLQKQDNSGLEATLLVIEFAFKVVQLNKLSSLVYAYNDSAQKLTLKLGFHQEGLLKQHLSDGKGQFIDIYHNALFAEDITTSNSKLSQYSKRLLGRDIAQEILRPSHNILADDPVAMLLSKHN